MILEVARALFPPQDPNPSVTLYRWLMWAAVMGLMLTVGWLVVNTASAGDLTALKQEVTSAKKAQLESQIFQKSIDSCMSDDRLKIANQQELARLVGEWRSLVKDNGANPPTLKSCADLGIAQ